MYNQPICLTPGKDGTPVTNDTMLARNFTGSAMAIAFSRMPVLRNLEFRDKASLRCDAIRKSKEYSNACAAYIVGVVARGECDYMAGRTNKHNKKNGTFLRPVYVPGYMSDACCSCYHRNHAKDCRNMQR